LPVTSGIWDIGSELQPARATMSKHAVARRVASISEPPVVDI